MREVLKPAGFMQIIFNLDFGMEASKYYLV